MNDTGIRLGKSYAEALFELAGQSNMADEVKGDLDAIMGLYAAEKDFRILLTSPCFSCEKKEEFFGRLLAGKIADLTMKFVLVAIKHNRMAFLPLIAASYNELWEDYRKYRRVKVVTRKALSESQKQSIAQDIAAALNEKIDLEAEVNPSIIGGIVIRYDDSIIDNSVAKRLESAVKGMMSRSKRRELIK